MPAPISHRPYRSRAALWLTMLLASIPLAGCGSSTVGPDDSVAFLAGEWVAVKLVVASKANPATAPDLIALGFGFFVNVQPSGQYTAILTAFGQPATEFGRIQIRGNYILFHREQPSPARTDSSTYRVVADTLFLVGDTEFDFDRDGRADPGTLSTSLVKRR